MSRHVNSVGVQAARQLQQQGLTHQEIATRLGCGERTIRRWLRAIPGAYRETSESLALMSGIVVSPDWVWPKAWTIDALADLPDFDRSRWEANLTMVEVAQRQANAFLPWYFRRLVETGRSYSDAPRQVNPWLYSIAGLSVLAEWLAVPECADLGRLIEGLKPWQGSRPRREYRKAAQPYVNAIEHGVMRVLVIPPRSVDTQYPIEILLRLLAAWVPSFDRVPMMARVWRMGIGHLFLHIFRNPKPTTGVK